MIITFVGSRALTEIKHQKVARLFYKVAYRCAELGITMRSGGADGADVIAETAYADAIKDGKAQESQVEIYVPWKPFQAVRGTSNPLSHLHIVPKVTDYNIQLVNEIHPNPSALSQGAFKLHSRNCNQDLGLDLNTPTDAVICWTEKGLTTGGTATAINLAIRHNIPVFNLGKFNTNHVLMQIKQLLIEKGVILNGN